MSSLSIIYQTPDFIAVNKPAGILTHATAASQEKKEAVLTDWLLEKYPEIKTVGDEPEIRPGIVHRLDRDTSGIILICRNQKFFEYLKKLFQARQIKKTYLALVEGELMPKTGIIKTPIGVKIGTIKRSVWRKKVKNFKEAITEYRVKNYYSFDSQTFSLTEIFPQTGRTHQIRIHLTSLGHPVVGDRMYGRRRTKPLFDLNRHFLHCFSLEFSLPSKNDSAGRRLKLETELPEELRKVLQQLKKN